VVDRGCAIPVAWKSVPATAKGSWKEPWLALRESYQGVVPAGWTVMVLADRGLSAQWRFEGICKWSGQRRLRLNQGGKFRPAGWVPFVPLASLAPPLGARGRGRGTAFAMAAAAQRDGTRLAFWGAGHAEAWLVLTDWAPERSDASWYGLRSWIAQFCKDGQRGGWQGQRTRRTEAARAERLGLGLAVATRWLVRAGGVEEVAGGRPLPEWAVVAAGARPKARRWRLVSVFARGWVVLVVARVNHRRLPLGRLLPESWPVVPHLPEPAQAQSEIKKVA
jgi:hypothetical protein